MEVREAILVRNARQAVLANDCVNFSLRLPLNIRKAGHREEEVADRCHRL